MNPAVVRRIGIVGAGLAGLAAALAAAMAGVSVDVFDTVEAGAPHDTHLHVAANLLRDLDTLGIAGACIRQGFPCKGMVVADVQGEPYFEFPTPRLAGEHLPPALGMVRTDLLNILRHAAIARGVTLHGGQAIVDVKPGTELVTHTGERHRVDLAVLTGDGTQPTTRGRALPQVPIETLPQAWCQTLVPRPHAVERATIIVGHSRHKVVLVPVDTRRAGAAVLWASELPSVNDVRELLASQGGLLRTLSPHWAESAPVSTQPVRFGMLTGRWHAPGLLRIGRSALVLPPHLGQSAAQAVEDAVVLGDLLRAQTPLADLPHAFEIRRADRARRVLEIASQAARWGLQPEPATDMRTLAERLAPLIAMPA